MSGEIPTDALAAVLVASFQADDLSAQRAAADYLMRHAGGIEFLDLAGRVTLGLVLLLEGDAAGSLDVLRPIGLPPNAWNIDMSAAATRSLATSDLGDAVEAERIARASLARAEEWGLSTSRVGGSLWLALGNALAAQGRPRDALSLLERALGSWGVPGTLHRAHILILLASSYQSVGDSAKARAAAREARGILDVCPNAGSLPARLGSWSAACASGPSARSRPATARARLRSASFDCLRHRSRSGRSRDSCTSRSTPSRRTPRPSIRSSAHRRVPRRWRGLANSGSCSDDFTRGGSPRG